MNYIAGLLIGLAGRDYDDVDKLVHSTRLIAGKRVRVFSMSEALAIINGYHDARRFMGQYAVD